MRKLGCCGFLALGTILTRRHAIFACLNQGDVQGSIDQCMTLEIALFLALFAIALVLFTFEGVPADVTAMGLMLALVVLGLLDASEAFAGFGSETVLMILGLLIITETLINTGMIELAGQYLLNLVGTNRRRLRILMLVAPAMMSAFISNTASAAFFLPIALGLADRIKISSSKLLMPLAADLSALPQTRQVQHAVVGHEVMQHQDHADDCRYFRLVSEHQQPHRTREECKLQCQTHDSRNSNCGLGTILDP